METSKVSFRLGADPATGKPISVIGYINADKWHPHQIPDMAPGFTLQEDNVSLEYGIPPAATVEEFTRSINLVMQRSLAYVPNLSFSKMSCLIFPKDQMEHPMAHVFGCEPDLNAWTGKENMKPRPPHKYMRSAGGHVHVETQKDPSSVIKAMDLFLGVPSVLMDEGEDRKKLYGSAGAHRVKPYGVEYRTLSNFWIFDDRLIKWVWDNTERALASDIDLSSCAKDIIKAINKNDKVLAKQLVDHFELEVV